MRPETRPSPAHLIPEITPRARGKIVRKLADKGKWSGSRQAVKMSLALLAQKNLHGERIFWRVYIRHQPTSVRYGTAGTVATALDAMREALNPK